MKIRQARKIARDYAWGRTGLITERFGTIITAINKMKSYTKRKGMNIRGSLFIVNLPGNYKNARNNCN